MLMIIKDNKCSPLVTIITENFELNDFFFSDTGNAYMNRQGIPYDNIIDLWINEIALVIIAVVFLSLAYIQMKRSSKPR